VAENSHHDFRKLVALDVSSLLIELADTHTNLANLHVEVGFLKGEKARDPKSYATPKLFDLEGELHAYEEKKWLIVALLRNYEV
jgi:hypothetical protein